MIVFWIGAAALLAAVLAIILVPLLRRAEMGPARAAYDVGVFRDQLSEIDRDIERGLLSPAQAEQARLEIQRRMLAADRADGDAAADDGRHRGAATVVAVIIAAGLPIGALVVYMSLGSPGTPGLPFAERPRQATTETAQGGQMEALLGQLAARLQENPDNLEGWLLLGKSAATMGRMEQSMEAYDRALALSGRRADVLSAYGEVLVAAHDGRVSDTALAAFEEVLQKEPEDPRARFYLGIAMAQQGDLAGALDAWTALADSAAPDAPWLNGLRQQIRAAARELGVEPPAVAIAPTPPPAAVEAPVVAPGPTREDMEAAAEMSADDRTQMIRGMVEGLAERLNDQPDDLDGWIRLERAYRVLGETKKADAAAKRIAALRAGG